MFFVALASLGMVLGIRAARADVRWRRTGCLLAVGGAAAIAAVATQTLARRSLFENVLLGDSLEHSEARAAQPDLPPEWQAEFQGFYARDVFLQTGERIHIQGADNRSVEFEPAPEDESLRDTILKLHAARTTASRTALFCLAAGLISLAIGLFSDAGRRWRKDLPQLVEGHQQRFFLRQADGTKLFQPARFGDAYVISTSAEEAQSYDRKLCFG